MSSMTLEQIKAYVDENFPEGEITLFTGLEDAFMGIAVRFEPISVEDAGGDLVGTRGATHRHFAVYSYSKIMEGLVKDGMDHDDAAEHVSYNIMGAFGGVSTPAILLDEADLPEEDQ
jgi:hypothetical protein